MRALYAPQATITLKTYTHEFDAARRSDDRRKRLEALYRGSVEASVEASGSSEGLQTTPAPAAKVVDLSALGPPGSRRQQQ